MTAVQITGSDVLFGLNVADKKALIEVLAAEAARRLGLAEAEIRGALLARERLGSTALGHGVAMPHAQLSGMTRPITLIARLARAVDYEAGDSEPVDVVVLVLWPQASPAGFLSFLAGTCRLLRDPSWRRKLRAAREAEEIAALFTSGTHG